MLGKLLLKRSASFLTLSNCVGSFSFPLPTHSKITYRVLQLTLAIISQNHPWIFEIQMWFCKSMGIRKMYGAKFSKSREIWSPRCCIKIFFKGRICIKSSDVEKSRFDFENGTRFFDDKIYFLGFHDLSFGFSKLDRPHTDFAKRPSEFLKFRRKPRVDFETESANCELFLEQ